MTPLLAPHGGLYAHVSIGDSVQLALPADDGTTERLWVVVEEIDRPGADSLRARLPDDRGTVDCGLRHVLDWRRRGSPSPFAQAVAAAEWWVSRWRGR